MAYSHELSYEEFCKFNVLGLNVQQKTTYPVLLSKYSLRRQKKAPETAEKEEDSSGAKGEK